MAKVEAFGALATALLMGMDVDLAKATKEFTHPGDG
jgi:hypothetical protein